MAQTVDAAEALHHALPGDEVAHHVIGIEVDAHLAGGSRDEEGGLVERNFFPSEKAELSQLRRSIDPLFHPPRPDE